MYQIHFSTLTPGLASGQDRKSTIRRLSPEDEGFDFIKADMALGIACQDLCQSRDDLADYALRKRLVPYLAPFLQRRGWIDNDWAKRLQVLNESFLHQVNEGGTKQ